MRRGALYGLVGALAVALVAVAFLLGRQTAAPAVTDGSAPEAAPIGTPASTGAAPPPAPARRPEPRPMERAPATPVARAAPVQATTPPPAPRAVPPAPAAAPGPDPRATAAMERYFEEIDRLGAAGAMGDPEEVATAIVGDGASGNWASFDELARTQRSQLTRLRAMNVPPDARAYHSRTIALVEAGIDLMAKVKRGMERGDTMALTTLSSDAQRMQGEAAEAERLGAALRAKYGLRAP